MDVRTFPVLTDEDEGLVERLSVGLGENTARVLTYLLCRHGDPDLADAATRTAVHIGAGVSKNAAATALDDLVAADLIAETTAATAEPGRPPKAWHAVAPQSETVRRTYARHADRLIEQGEQAAAVLESDPPEADGRDSATELDRHSDERPGPEHVSVALNWRSNALHLPLFAARSAAESDVLLAFEEYDGSRAAATAVASADCDVGIAGAATLLRERARGRPIVPIAVCFQRSMVVLYTTRAAFGGPFDRLEQLDGRRVGIRTGTETGLLGRLLLEQAGIRESVDLVDVGGEEQAALQSGEVDAVTGMVPDPDRLELAEQRVEVVAVSDAYPAYGPALVTAEETLRRRRERVTAVLVAAMAGWANAVCATDAAASDFASETDDSPERIARTFEAAVDRFGGDAVRRRGWGWHSPDDWRNLRDALAQGGIVAD
ncbi:ABC transporter substrate-binding protein [Natrinema marinum]|uniref:ABC transporter substrate-binding protein n=1 Tax=Natrinema marinum TaxID=2961598 RepID=UPI0020C84254|nr:ABC transporter substrate-binding protein [Natrinema marinum]